MRGWSKKIFLTLLLAIIASTAFYFPQPKKAQALFGIDFCGTFFICLDPINDVAAPITATSSVPTATATGITGAATSAKVLIDGTVTERAITDTLLTPNYCDSIDYAIRGTDRVRDTVGNITVGDDTDFIQVINLTVDIEAKQNLLDACWGPLARIANGAKGATISQSDNIERNRSIAAVQASELKHEIQDKRRQRKDAMSKIFKGFIFSLGLKLSDYAVKEGFDELNERFAIKKKAEYIDAAIGLKFGIEHIKKHNSGDKEGELIVASLFRNKMIGDATKLNTAAALANQKAEKYRVKPTDLDWSDPSMWSKVAEAPRPEIWGETHMMIAQERLHESMHSSQKTAEDEVNVNKNFKSLQKCTDVSAKQKQIDTAIATATREMEEAATTKAKAEYLEATPEVIAQAEAKYRAAEIKYKQMVAQSEGGLVKWCDVVTRWGVNLQETAQGYVHNWLQEHMTWQDAHLPKMLQTVTQILPNIVFGIFQGKSGGQTFDEVKSLAGLGISAGTQAALNSIGRSAEQRPAPNTPPTFPTGNDGPFGPLNNGNGNGGTSAYQGLGSVAGATTVSPRGPQAQFMPRGPEPTFND